MVHTKEVMDESRNIWYILSRLFIDHEANLAKVSAHILD
jgi:hypothetical protein